MKQKSANVTKIIMIRINEIKIKINLTFCVSEQFAIERGFPVCP